MLPKDDLEAILQSKKGMEDMRDHIKNVCKEYRIGKRLFGSGNTTLMNQDVQELMDKAIEEMLKLEKLTNDTAFEAKEKCIEAIENTSFYQNLAQVRKVEMSYRGWTYKQTVHGAFWILDCLSIVFRALDFLFQCFHWKCI